ncbi:hypothetical protein EfmGK941_30100 (plasmid) [Enterococcus faecium]|nr:hypothetical protein EfmGK941_30100 [Enterococcus faecium]
MKLFVGIDVSSEKLDVCFLTDDNQLSILSEISVANDIEGASFIRETILEFNDSYHFDQIVIGMESNCLSYLKSLLPMTSKVLHSYEKHL